MSGAQQPIIFADPDEVLYELKGEFYPVENLTDRQLRRAWHETIKQMGRLSEDILKLEQKHDRRLKILERISQVTEQRGLERMPTVMIVSKPID